MVDKLIGPGRLPLPKNLLDKTPEELMNTLARFGIDPDLDAIDINANRAYARLAKAISEGVQPDDALWASLEAQHEREMTQSLRQATKSAIRDYRVDKLNDGDASHFLWVDVGDDNECPSCLRRHGQVKTMPQWEAVGLPGSGALICSTECRCHLVPV